jgi:pimeloyl-ACP methyl ester carboxylesterase
VWKHIIKHYSAKEIYIVAHSYGGKVATDLADQSKVREPFRKRVKKIAFTDSVHSFQLQGTSTAVKEWLASHSRNWICSIDPLDQEQGTAKGMVPKVSAGTTKHEETSSHAMQSIFKFFAEEEDLD